MFISRTLSICEQNAHPLAQSLQLRQKNQRGAFHRECAYRFPDLPSLLAVCHRLSTIGYIGSNSAYADVSDRYYLLLTVLSESPFSTPDELGFITEYGTLENAALLRIYLSEHGRVLCAENAVYQLGALA